MFPFAVKMFDVITLYLLEMFIGSGRLFLLCEWTDAHTRAQTHLCLLEASALLSALKRP